MAWALKTLFISPLAQAAWITGSSAQFHRPIDSMYFGGVIQKATFCFQRLM
jgi:hypothetical protein